MLISNLPSDVLAAIFFRVPLTYMRAVRLTCKNWNDLSKSQGLMKMRIDQAAEAAAKEGEYQMIVRMGNNLNLTSIFLNGDRPSAERKVKLTCLDEQVKLSRIFPCEGLLLCILNDCSKFVVWNPYLGQTRWIKTICHRPPDVGSFSYALGYVNKESCRSYKLLRFNYYYYYDVSRKQVFWYEIYDFESDLWTTHDVTTPQWRINCGECGLSFKGNAYFCAAKRNAKQGTNHGWNDHIILFHFTSERFGPLLRLPFNAGLNDYVVLSCVREEKLAVLLQQHVSSHYEHDIWITTKIEREEVSWIKFLRLGSHSYMQYIRRSYFYIDEEKKLVIAFDDNHRNAINIFGEAGYFRSLNLVGVTGDHRSRPHVFSYVPTVVQLKQPAGGEMEQQRRDLEKRLYDDHFLRVVASH